MSTETSTASPIAKPNSILWGHGRKSGYCSAEIIYYGLFDRKRENEPKKTEKVEDGPLYIGGADGYHLSIEKKLDERFQSEISEIVEELKEVNFNVTEIKSFQNKFLENTSRTLVKRGNIVLSLSNRIKSEHFLNNHFLERPRDYYLKSAFLEYEITTEEEPSKEEEIFIDGLKAILSKDHGLRTDGKCPTCNLPINRRNCCY